MSLPVRHIIVDANGLIHRTYNALYSHNGEDNLSIGLMVYSFLRQILSFCSVDTRESGPFTRDIFYLVWDAPDGRLYRQDFYPPYKSNRKEPASILSETRGKLLRVLPSSVSERLGIWANGAEADDLIQILVEHLPPDETILICTGDKDLLQCMVHDKVAFYDWRAKKVITPIDFEKEYHFGVDLWPFYKAMVGDSSDNWPGVRGIGPKTFYKLLAEPRKIAELSADVLETINLGIALCRLPVEDRTEWIEYINNVKEASLKVDGWLTVLDQFELRPHILPQLQSNIN